MILLLKCPDWSVRRRLVLLASPTLARDISEAFRVPAWTEFEVDSRSGLVVGQASYGGVYNGGGASMPHRPGREYAIRYCHLLEFGSIDPPKRRAPLSGAP